MEKNANLKIALFEEGIIQSKLSSATGVPRSYISMAINGRLNLEKNQKLAISKALNREVDDIFEAD